MRLRASAGEAFAEWRKDAAYLAEYEALEEEFALAEAFAPARRPS